MFKPVFAINQQTRTTLDDIPSACALRKQHSELNKSPLAALAQPQHKHEPFAVVVTQMSEWPGGTVTAKIPGCFLRQRFEILGGPAIRVAC
jgi:hypothetical protein